MPHKSGMKLCILSQTSTVVTFTFGNEFRNLVPHFMKGVITYPCSLIYVSKRGPGVINYTKQFWTVKWAILVLTETFWMALAPFTNTEPHFGWGYRLNIQYIQLNKREVGYLKANASPSNPRQRRWKLASHVVVTWPKVAAILFWSH